MLTCCRSHTLLTLVFLSALFAAVPLATGATIEYLDGTRFECKVLFKDETNVVVEVTSAGMLVKRTIPLAKVHKVTINDKIYVINERPTGKTANSVDSAKSTSPAAGKTTDEASTETGKVSRTKAEIDSLINEQGRKPPEWYETTPLNYPTTLDLSWPDGPPPGGWNNQKNVGQYVWDIINHNPSKWREGVRLMHHLLTIHKGRKCFAAGIFRDSNT
jgi:hypothetical protein